MDPKYLDKDYLLKLGDIDPELKSFLETNPLPQVDYSDISYFKKMVENRNATMMKMLGNPPPEIKQSELEYPTADGTKIRAKLYQPQPAPKNGSPLIVMYHGGGFCIGSPEGQEQSCRNLVLAFGATCISATYRLAPEFKFPYATMDSWDALKWAAANASSWGADLKKGFIIGGTSAGGQLTGALAQMARDNGLSPPLTGQYLAIPAAIPESDVPDKYKPWYLSQEQNKAASVLPREAIEMFMNAYQPDEKDPRFHLALNPKGHKGLPPAVFQIDGMDPLRDEGIIYARILDEAGVKVKVYDYPGLPHGHWGFFPFLKGSDKFRREEVEGVGWLLGANPDFSKVKTHAEPATV